MSDGTNTGRRVRFVKDFDYQPTARVVLAYKADTTAFVKRDCAEKAIARGCAVPVTLDAPPGGLKALMARGRPRHGR